MTTFTRRDLLRSAAAVAMLASLPAVAACTSDPEPTVDVPEEGHPVFPHGVASGDPLPTAVILWTRVRATAPVDVTWEIARDATFADVVGRGSSSTSADRDYTVKVDAGGLEPGTTYYYRFTALGLGSPIGRTRTAPLTASRLRFAVVSCASLPHGFFHVYRAIAERPDIDAVLHLGDYIYEYGDAEYGDLRTSEPEHALVTLDDYRTRYAQYRRDADLQEAHRQHPFVCTWDDHEFADNAWKGGAENHDPEKEGTWEERKRAAQRAYSEWIPVRDQEPGKIWRSLVYGDLAELVFLDTRVWGRDAQAKDAQDPSLLAGERQLLGADQEAWLGERLRSSQARWKLVCQQIILTALPPSSSTTDGWDGYPKARERFFDVLEKTPVNDVVVLSGDVHSSWACDLPRAPADPRLYDRATGKGSLAVELVAPAVTSPGPETTSTPESLRAANGAIRFVDLDKRGFILLDVDAKRVHAAYLHVASVTAPEPQALAFTTGFATYAGENRLRYEPIAPERPVDAAPLAPAPPAPVITPNTAT